MTTVREIRIIDRNPYYCTVSYDNNKYGTIISINKRIVARLNQDTPAEMRDGKIINIIKEEEKPKINDNKPVEIITEKVETELNETELDVIETDNEVTNEVENMEINEENLMRKMEDRIDAKERQKLSEIRTQKFEQELAETKAQINEFGSVVDSKLGGFVNNIGSKLDNIASATAMISEVKKREAADEASAKIRMMTHKSLPPVDEIDCPNGLCGHKLKKIDEHTLKCTGSNCGKEIIMVEKTADAFCTNCKLPLNSKHKYEKGCPMCGSTHADYYKKK